MTFPLRSQGQPVQRPRRGGLPLTQGAPQKQGPRLPGSSLCAKGECPGPVRRRQPQHNQKAMNTGQPPCCASGRVWVPPRSTLTCLPELGSLLFSRANGGWVPSPSERLSPLCVLKPVLTASSRLSPRDKGPGCGCGRPGRWTGSSLPAESFPQGHGSGHLPWDPVSGDTKQEQQQAEERGRGAGVPCGAPAGRAAVCPAWCPKHQAALCTAARGCGGAALQGGGSAGPVPAAPPPAALAAPPLVPSVRQASEPDLTRSPPPSAPWSWLQPQPAVGHLFPRELIFKNPFFPSARNGGRPTHPGVLDPAVLA